VRACVCVCERACECVSITQGSLIHKVQLCVEGGQVRILLLDHAGDEVEQSLGAVRRLGLQQLTDRGGAGGDGD